MRPENRLNLDYRTEAKTFKSFPFGIIDVHSHINGKHAIMIFKEIMDLYGVERVYSMTNLENVKDARDILGDRLRVITMAIFGSPDPAAAMGRDYVQRIRDYHQQGARIAKFWSAPRIYDFGSDLAATSPFRINAPARLDAMQCAVDLGMALMVHVGDPDTWFQTKYLDSTRYGTKAEQYDPLREILTRFGAPLIAAHMGGWPEDLKFLSELLASHSNLYLDTSATKWQVRELSKHPREELLAFLQRWKGRILFGSDIVTSESHLKSDKSKNEMTAKANSEAEAFDLYASRYWALRKLFETNYRGESPIADPDLHMTDPKKYDLLSAPELKGFELPADILQSIYHDAAHDLLEPLYK